MVTQGIDEPSLPTSDLTSQGLHLMHPGLLDEVLGKKGQSFHLLSDRLLGKFVDSSAQVVQIPFQGFEVVPLNLFRAHPLKMLIDLFPNPGDFIGQFLSVFDILQLIGQKVQQGVCNRLSLLHLPGSPILLIPHMQCECPGIPRLGPGNRIVVPHFKAVGHPISWG